MMERDVRLRLLTVLDILKKKKKRLSVKEIIEQIHLIDSWYEVERRSIYADLKSLEQFGHIVLSKKGKGGSFYAQIADDHDL